MNNVTTNIFSPETTELLKNASAEELQMIDELIYHFMELDDAIKKATALRLLGEAAAIKSGRAS